MQVFRPQARLGLTLVEMLIVVAVVAIFAALAAPSLGRTDRTRVVSAARMLVADLAYAQIESMSHSDDLRVVVIDDNAVSYAIATQGDLDTPITSPITKQPYRVTLGQGRASHLAGVTIASYDFGGNDWLRFDLYGALDQPDDATITLTCGSYTVTVTIDAITGQAMIGAVNQN